MGLCMTLKLTRLPLCLGLVACLAAGGCGDDTDSTTDTDAGAKAGSGGKGGSGGSSGKGGTGGTGGSGGSADTKDAGTASGSVKGPFVVATLVSAGDGSLTYINFLDSLEGQDVDFKAGREFSGDADLWVRGDTYFVADDETNPSPSTSAVATRLATSWAR